MPDDDFNWKNWGEFLGFDPARPPLPKESSDIGGISSESAPPPTPVEKTAQEGSIPVRTSEEESSVKKILASELASPPPGRSWSPRQELLKFLADTCHTILTYLHPPTRIFSNPLLALHAGESASGEITSPYAFELAKAVSTDPWISYQAGVKWRGKGILDKAAITSGSTLEAVLAGYPTVQVEDYLKKRLPSKSPFTLLRDGSITATSTPPAPTSSPLESAKVPRPAPQSVLDILAEGVSRDPRFAFAAGLDWPAWMVITSEPVLVEALLPHPRWSFEAGMRWKRAISDDALEALARSVASDKELSAKALSLWPAERTGPHYETLLAAADRPDWKSFYASLPHQLQSFAKTCRSTISMTVLESISREELLMLRKGYILADQCERLPEFVKAFEQGFFRDESARWIRWADLQDAICRPDMPGETASPLLTYLSMAPFETIVQSTTEDILAHSKVYTLFKAVASTTLKRDFTFALETMQRGRGDYSIDNDPELVALAQKKYLQFLNNTNPQWKESWIATAHRFGQIDDEDKPSFLTFLKYASIQEAADVQDHVLSEVKQVYLLATSMKANEGDPQFLMMSRRDRPRRPAPGDHTGRIYREYLAALREGQRSPWIDAAAAYEIIDDGRKNEFSDLLSYSSPETVLGIPQEALHAVLDAFYFARIEQQEPLFASELATSLKEGGVHRWATTILDYFKGNTKGGGTYRIHEEPGLLRIVDGIEAQEVSSNHPGKEGSSHHPPMTIALSPSAEAPAWI